MKNNHVLPRWIEISKEIDDLKEKLKENTNTAEAANLIRTINKKVLEHNLLCPASAQKRGENGLLTIFMKLSLAI